MALAAAPGELLVDDRLDQRREVGRRASPTDANRAGRRDQAGEHRVTGRQDLGGRRRRHPGGLVTGGHPLTGGPGPDRRPTRPARA